MGVTDEVTDIVSLHRVVNANILVDNVDVILNNLFVDDHMFTEKTMSLQLYPRED